MSVYQLHLLPACTPPCSGPAGPGERTDVGRLLRQQAAALTSVPWQVLQLADTNVPGRFKVRAATRRLSTRNPSVNILWQAPYPHTSNGLPQ
jgi:hypothetical protein